MDEIAKGKIIRKPLRKDFWAIPAIILGTSIVIVAVFIGSSFMRKNQPADVETTEMTALVQDLNTMISEFDQIEIDDSTLAEI